LRGVVSIGIKELEDALPYTTYNIRPTIRITRPLPLPLPLLLVLLSLAALVTHSVSLHLMAVVTTVQVLSNF
jgi:hypothetical protein